MRYVIFRDDDTNALTPVECLESLYRPFLERGLPVNLATIPEVSTNARMADGRPEGFLLGTASRGGIPTAPTGPTSSAQQALRPCSSEAAERVAASTICAGEPAASGGRQLHSGRTIPLGENSKLVTYLRENEGFHILQHGCHHDYLEFDRPSYGDIAARLDEGTEALMEAGFARPRTFVAPYDRVSRAGLPAVAERFRVFSTGWFELRKLPYAWWPKYAFKKMRHAPHWKVKGTLLLSHPGCLLSCQRTYSTMLGGIIHYLESQQLTVLVTHWWEYFRDGKPDEPFIDFLHETASYVATHPQLKAVAFDDLLSGRIPLN